MQQWEIDDRKKSGEPLTKLGDVSLVNDCLLCDSQVILMATRQSKNKQMMPSGSQLPNICDKCKEKYLVEGNGIALINPETYSVAVVSQDFFENNFTVPIPKGRMCFVEGTIVEQIIEMSKQV